MLLRKIEQFLRKHDMAYSRFGRDCMGDPRLMIDLRNGRELRRSTEKRIRDWMQDYKGKDNG